MDKENISRKRADISLVVPCYNEAGVIRNTAVRLVKVFQDREVDLELILVDNGSHDATGVIIDELIDEGLPVVKVTVSVNQGYGNGILMGLKATSGRFIGFTCADGQVEAYDVGKVYDIAANVRDPHLVKVRRRFRMDGFTRKIVSIVYNLGITTIFGGLSSIDINGNPKIMPSEYLQQMNLQSKDWFLDAEVMIKAKHLQLPVFEINVIAQMREDGKSNVRGITIWEFIKNIWRYRFGGQDVLQLQAAEQAKPEFLKGGN